MLRSSRLRGWGRRLSERFAPKYRPGRRTIGGVLYWFEQRAMQKLALRKSLPELAARIVQRLVGEPDRLVVACLAGYEEHIPQLPAQKVLRLTMPAATAQGTEFHLSGEIIERDATGRVLLVFAPISLLASWDGIGEDAWRALTRFDQVLLVLVQPYFAIQRLQDFSWVLSLLVGALAPGRFNIRIDAVTLGADRDLVRHLLRLCFPSFWLRSPGQLMRCAEALLRRGLSYPISDADAGPERFSVLLLDLTRRGA